MDDKVHYEKRYEELVKIIESFERLEKSKEWEILKEYVFSRSLTSLERQLLLAAQEVPVDPSKLYSLQGELKWAKRYNDVNRFIESLKKELQAVKANIQ